VEYLEQEAARERAKYFEIRSVDGAAGTPASVRASSSFCLHRLDLSPGLDELFRAFHGDCIRRKIARAERESLRYVKGTSEQLLQEYYRLAVQTRRRHQIPPQPLSWLRNLIASFGQAAKIRLALHQGQPVAGIFTIRYKSTLTYKYACSDVRFHRLGAMQMLLWKAIQEAKEEGLLELDLGRTDWSNEGLLAYKDRWGAKRFSLFYLRNPPSQPHYVRGNLSSRMAKRIFAWVPDRILIMTGNLLYRHIA
jgi:lipid II:glycine glycyltransferase (peptidoglycan interpeptide bridge formation enzyme)